MKKTKTELTSEITALKALQRTSAGSGSSNSTSRYGYGYGRAPAAISPAHSQTSLEPPVEEIVSEPFDLEASKTKVRAAVGQLLADTSNTKTRSSVNFYLGKIIDEPSAPQFRRINLTNRAVQREGWGFLAQGVGRVSFGPGAQFGCQRGGMPVVDGDPYTPSSSEGEGGACDILEQDGYTADGNYGLGNSYSMAPDDDIADQCDAGDDIACAEQESRKGGGE